MSDDSDRLQAELDELHAEYNAALCLMSDIVARYRPNWAQVPDLPALAGQISRILQEKEAR